MKLCKKCKKKVANKVKVCPNCGNDVSKAKIIPKKTNVVNSTKTSKEALLKKDEINKENDEQIKNDQSSIKNNDKDTSSVKKQTNKSNAKNKYNKMVNNIKKEANKTKKNTKKKKSGKAEQTINNKIENIVKETLDDQKKNNKFSDATKKVKDVSHSTAKSISLFFKDTALKTKQFIDSKKPTEEQKKQKQRIKEEKNKEKEKRKLEIKKTSEDKRIQNQKDKEEKNKEKEKKKLELKKISEDKRIQNQKDKEAQKETEENSNSTGNNIVKRIKDVSLSTAKSISLFFKNTALKTKQFIDIKKPTEEQKKQKQRIKEEKNKEKEKIKEHIAESLAEEYSDKNNSKEEEQTKYNENPADIIKDRNDEVVSIFSENKEQCQLGKTQKIFHSFKSSLLKEEQDEIYEDEGIRKSKFLNKKTFGFFLLLIIVSTAAFCMYQFIHMSSLNNAIEINENNYGKTYEMNQRIAFNGIAYKITEARIVEGTDYKQPKEGYNFVQVTIELDNISEDKAKYSYKDFKVKDSNGNESARVFTPINATSALYSGKIVVGGKKLGSLVFEEPIGDENLVLNFYKTEEIITETKDETTSETSNNKETKETLIYSVKLSLQK